MSNHYWAAITTSEAPDRSWGRSGSRQAVRGSTLWTFLLMLLLSVLLAGCGGGGGDGGSGGGGGGGGGGGTLYSVGGTISGLNGTVVLRNNGDNDLSRSANGSFTFGTSLASGSSYAVTVLTQPSGQTCAVANGSGTVGSANVGNVAVTCTNNPADPALSNANLASLTLSSGTLDQIFVPGQLAYSSTQPFPVTSLQVTPATENSGATVRVNGSAVTSGQASQTIALAAGAVTNITVAVTAANGTTTRTYTVAVTRQSGSGFAQQAYIKASNPDGVAENSAGAGDQFGYATAVSEDGNTLVVGAVYESSNATGINGNQANNTAPESGAVYVFVRSGATWTQQAYVKASNAGQFDHFGESVALSSDGNTLAVSAPTEDSAATGINGDQADNSITNAGAVYVFTRSGTTWTQQAYVKASSNIYTAKAFGLSLALSGDGDTLAVGADDRSNATGINGSQSNTSAGGSGAVYVFTRGGTTWSQQAYVKASNTEGGDAFGEDVALSSDGNTLVVGAGGEDSNATGINGSQTNNSASTSGAVYVFTRGGGTWSQQAYVKASNTDANDRFGIYVALSGDGNTLAVSAVDVVTHGEASNATGINGDQTNNSAPNSGAVYVFTRSGTTWTQQAYVKSSNSEASDRFGWGIALSGDGNRLAVGAFGEDSNAIGINGNQANNSASGSGAAYVFARSGTTWTQRAYVKSSNSEAGDLFGHSIALSGNGDTLAVGADGEDSSAPGINGDQTNNTRTSSGAVYVFTGVGAD